MGTPWLRNETYLDPPSGQHEYSRFARCDAGFGKSAVKKRGLRKPFLVVTATAPCAGVSVSPSRPATEQGAAPATDLTSGHQ